MFSCLFIKRNEIINLGSKYVTTKTKDKSVSVETCKTTNRIVRDYLGITGKGMFLDVVFGGVYDLIWFDLH